MRDQAQDLRARGNTFRPAPLAPADRGAVVVFAGGKGGVGASTVTVLVGAALARRGRRVLLVDGAQNEGALHLLVGVRPVHTLGDLAAGTATIGMLPQGVADGLWLVPAASGSAHLYALSHADRARLHLRVTALFDDYDIVLVDSGSGLESAVRAAALRAHFLVAVTTPDPVALSLTHALVKVVRAQLPGLPVGTLLQRAGTAEARLAQERLGEAARRFLDCALFDLGSLPEDDELRERGGLSHALLAPLPAALAERVDALAEQLVAHAAPIHAEGSDAR